MSAPELRVGITSFQDAAMLELCLDSLERTLSGVRHEIVVVDKASTDGSGRLARARGARVLDRQWGQSDALNWLLLSSRAEYTLLLHSDAVLLAPDWFPLVAGAIGGDVALVSPEDIGVGPFLRAKIGPHQPESSFLFWSTRAARRLRRFLPRHVTQIVRHRLPFVRALNLYHFHVTHYLPTLLERAGLTWQPMTVLPSPLGEQWFEFEPTEHSWWQPEWGRYEYGFGNFYALDGTITHYHQWYSRDQAVDPAALNADGVPVAFLHEGAARFRRDYRSGTVRLPARSA